MSHPNHHNLVRRAISVLIVLFLLALCGSAGAQDTVPQPPDSVEQGATGEPEGGTPKTDEAPPADGQTGEGTARPEQTPDGASGEGAEKPPPKRSSLTVLQEDFGIDVAEEGPEQLAARLAKLAQRIVDLEEAKKQADARATTAGTVRVTLDEQLSDELPAAARKPLVGALAGRTVTQSIFHGRAEAIAARLARQRQVQQLLADHAAQVAARAEKAPADVVDEAARARQDADQAEQDALEALRRAREREAQERDATIRELLARETKLAEELLALTRKHGEALLRLQEQTEDELSRFATAKAEILAEVDEIPEQPRPEVRRSEVDPVFRRLVTLRRQARERLSVARDLLSEAEREVRDAGEALAEAQEQVAEEQARAEQLEGTVGERRVAVAKAQLAVAEERHDAALSTRDTLQRRVAQYRVRIDFFSEMIHELLPLVSETQRDEFFRINDKNWQDAVAGVREGLFVIVDGGLERLDQLQHLDLSSIDVLGWIWGFTWRLVLTLIVLRVVPPMVPEQVRRLVGALFRRRFFRVRTRLTVKIGEVINSLAYPLLALFFVRFLLGGFVVARFPEAEVVLWLLDAGFFYWIIIEFASVIILPRWYRREQGKRSANELLDVDDGDAAMADLVGMEVERARKLVRSIQVVTVFGLLASYVPDLVARVTGINILWWFVDRVAVFGLIGIVYWVISTWKNDIASIFERLAASRLPGAVTFVNRQKDRPWGVLIIAVASVYVIVVELYLVVRKYVIDTEMFRRASTFAFRKKIEMQARERDESELPDGDVATLPDEYVDLFASKPLEPGSQLYIERGRWEDEVVEIYATWLKESRQGSVALIGEAGIGKTTMLLHIEAALEERHDVPVVFRTVAHKYYRRADVVEFIAELFELEEVPETKAELIKMIRGLEPRVIAIDDCHHFFVRRIGGFDGLDALLDIVNLTDERHFWLLTFNVFAWSYVNRVNAREHYFGRVMQLSQWSEDDIQALIEQRNAMSDWATSFTDLVVSHEETAGTDYFYEVVKTARGYFRYLHEFSDGNPRVASVFWLRSIRPTADRVMNVSLFRRPTNEALADISDNHWFVLTALAQHGELNPDEIARIINVNPGFCHLALNFFEEKGVVEVDPESERASLAPLYFRHVLRSLMNSNYLYR